jgi:hypothetical protein
MKRGSTLFLKVAILLFGTAVLALCIYLVYALIRVDVGGYRPILIGMLVAAIPFFIGAYQTFRLLNYIDQKKAFTELSVKALRKIKYCGITISALYAAGMPYIFLVAVRDDAPGVVLLGLIFTFAPLIIAVFSAVLQKMLQNAIDIKSENDLTI